MKQLETECWISQKTVSIGKRKYESNGIVLAQGEGLGFTELEVSAVDDERPTTVIFPYGSDKNLGSDYGADYLMLPDGLKELSKNTEKYGRLGQKKIQFDHIFPQGEFTVTEKIDTLTLKCDVDFNLKDCLIDDVEVIVTFQSGGLAGYDLAIVEGSWDNSKKQFKLKVNKEENALTVPGDINFSVGDKFILTGLKMPQSYIDKAEKQLQEEAQTWLDEHCEKRVQLKGKCDEGLFRQMNLFIACGQMVGVYSDQLKIDREIRVTKVKRYIENDNKPAYRYELTLSDFLQGNGFKDLVNDVDKFPDEIEDKVKPVREWTKRSWRDVMETLGMMFDPEGDYFTELIKPLAVHTAQLIVGTNSQQMDLIGVKFIPNADNDPNYFKSTAGKLVHFTVSEDEVREWVIPASSHRLNNAFPYYVYAKCPREGNTGSILASERQIKLLDDPNYYHFWVGVLNTPEDNVRSWLPNYGFTEIAGQTITTGLIKDKLARLVIDLVNAKITASNGATIEGKVTFKSGTSGYNNISDRPNLQPIYDGVSDALTEAENASNAANSAQSTANNKARVFYQTAAPKSGMRTNDLWVDGVNIYRYSGSSWVLASKYDNTITEINGGLITTGAIAFGNTGGMSASGTIRIWSGGTAGTKGQPPTDPTFRVESNGNVESRGSIYISNANGAKMAGFSGNGTSISSIRIWAGGSTPESGTFRVTQDGTAHMSKLNATGGSIGGFSIINNRLLWEGRDYFGDTSRTLKLGYGSNNDGLVDVAFGASTQGRFGVKAVGRAPGSAAIYGSSQSAQSYPQAGTVWAAWFDGYMFSDGYFTRSPKGVVRGGLKGAYRIDNSDTWFVFDNGIAVACTKPRSVDLDTDKF